MIIIIYLINKIKKNFYIRYTINNISKSKPKLNYLKSFNMKMNDNEYINIQYYLPPKFNNIILIIPGINSDITDEPINSIAYYFKTKGYAIFIKNWRGINTKNILEPELYFTEKTLNDLNMVLNHINTKYKDKKIIVIAHSLGGNTVLKYNHIYSNNCIYKIILIASPLKLYKSYLSFKKEPVFNKFMSGYINIIKTNSNVNTIKKLVNNDDNLTVMNNIFTNKLAVKNYKEFFKQGTITNDIINDLDKPTLWIMSENDNISYYKGIENDLHINTPFFYKLIYNYGEHGNYINTSLKKKFNLNEKLLYFIKN